jgi:hypothetical protein
LGTDRLAAHDIVATAGDEPVELERGEARSHLAVAAIERWTL